MSNTPDVSTILDNAKMQTDLETGEVCTYGYLDNLRVGMFPSGYSICGSLSKFYYGSNLYPLDVHTTALAIEKLSDALQMDLNQAKVTSLEFGLQFPMRKQVVEYLKKLGEMPKMLRHHFEPHTLYYQTKAKQQPKVLCFYDKILDARTKDLTIPKGFEDCNLLKYELRLNGRLPQQVGVNCVDVSTLATRDFYKRLVEMWQQHYFKIQRKHQLRTNIMSEIKTVSDAFNTFVALLINQSNSDQINGFVDELKAAKVFGDRKCYTRLKKKILDISQKANLVLSDEDIQELDDEIRNAGAYV